MAKGGMKAFEKSGKDIDTKAAPEGSKKDIARDKEQAKAAGFLRRGGKVKRK